MAFFSFLGPSPAEYYPWNVIGCTMGHRLRVGQFLVALWILCLLPTFSSTHAHNHDDKPISGFQIAPKACQVKGQEGTCMFVWECIKTEGTPLGMCMERFMFGSCCAHDIDNNVVPNFRPSTMIGSLPSRPSASSPQPSNDSPAVAGPSLASPVQMGSSTIVNMRVTPPPLPSDSVNSVSVTKWPYPSSSQLPQQTFEESENASSTLTVSVTTLKSTVIPVAELLNSTISVVQVQHTTTINATAETTPTTSEKPPTSSPVSTSTKEPSTTPLTTKVSTTAVPTSTMSNLGSTSKTTTKTRTKPSTRRPVTRPSSRRPPTSSTKTSVTPSKPTKRVPVTRPDIKDAALTSSFNSVTSPSPAVDSTSSTSTLSTIVSTSTPGFSEAFTHSPLSISQATTPSPPLMETTPKLTTAASVTTEFTPSTVSSTTASSPTTPTTSTTTTTLSSTIMPPTTTLTITSTTSSTSTSTTPYTTLSTTTSTTASTTSSTTIHTTPFIPTSTTTLTTTSEPTSTTASTIPYTTAFTTPFTTTSTTPSTTTSTTTPTTTFTIAFTTTSTTPSTTTSTTPSTTPSTISTTPSTTTTTSTTTPPTTTSTPTTTKTRTTPSTTLSTTSTTRSTTARTSTATTPSTTRRPPASSTTSTLRPLTKPTSVATSTTSTTSAQVGNNTPTGTDSSTKRPVMAVTSLPSTDPKVECGIAPLLSRQEGRIVGGTSAKFGSWPWQVSVRRTSFFGFSSTHRCGGALLNELWVVTAGHCVEDLLVSQIRLRMGEFDFSSVTEPYPFVERGVNKKVVHPKYNFFTYEYDLALVRLEEPVEFMPNIAPICLPASDDSLVGENGTVTGWGRLSEGGTLPTTLQQVTVPIVSNEKCKDMFLKAGRQEYIPDIFMCAGFEQGGRDSCQGDSGGPLQIRGRDGRYFLAGIISWGIGCAEANLPGVCTRISKFTSWILENVT